MKTPTRHPRIRSLMFVQIYMGLFVVLGFPGIITPSFQVYTVPLIMAIVLLFIPLGKPPVAATNLPKRRPFITSLLITVWAQLALLMAFYAICHLTAVTVPTLTPPTIHPLPLFTFSLNVLLTEWGLCPWGMYTLLAAALSYTCYIKQQPGDMSTLIRPLFNNRTGDYASLAADVTTKIAITITLATTLALLGWECLGLISHYLHLPVVGGLRLDVTTILAIVVTLNRTKLWKRLLQRFFRLHPSSTMNVSLFLLLVFLAFLVINCALHWLAPLLYPQRFSRVANFTTWSWPSMWGLFVGIWWVCWTPLLAGLYATIWRGYSIRIMIIMTLLLPLAAWTGIHMYPNIEVTISNTFNALNFIPAVLGLVSIIALFLGNKTTVYAWKATLPTSTRYYSYQAPHGFLYPLFQAIVLTAGLYWVGGSYLLSIPYFVLAFPTTLFVLAAGVALYKALITGYWNRPPEAINNGL